ncbi:ankyrin repeat-containing domain protein [Aspergillus avenaceus]|uniref:Ankyrin repeat-containing domain protein n=1 Tax=Aspergillus avenaceus TaxID=36643 RepID=A0A5N6TX06_ASPAV|nr:ankyrin repeat-containing domain protein [Aspergillus avenaceus]
MLSNIVLKQYRNTHYRIAQCPQWRAGSMQQGATILNQLPAELLYAVVENLDLKDLSQLAMVNQQFWGFLRSMLYRVGTRKEYTRQGRSGSRTWLEFAVTRAHVELASQLLDRGGDPRLAPDTCLDGDYRTALFYAVQYGMIDLVERIGLRLDDVSKVYDRNGSTLLHAAVLSQAPTLVDHILGFDRPWGLKGIRSHPSALYLAACNGYTQIVSRLLVAGANLNQCGCSGTVLQAIMKDDSCKAIQEDIITMLVEKGDDLHKKDDDGRTILHYAACSHVPDVVNLLIKLGAILETRDRLGNTPLHEAAGKGRIENVKALITAGASVDATNWFDMTPLMVAMRWEHGAASVEYLASVKADINAEDRTNMTPIHAAGCHLKRGRLRERLHFTLQSETSNQI